MGYIKSIPSLDINTRLARFSDFVNVIVSQKGTILQPNIGLIVYCGRKDGSEFDVFEITEMTNIKNMKEYLDADMLFVNK